MSHSIYVAYGALLAMACTPIYFGSLRSAKPAQKVETISSKDAYLFPLYASAALFGLYLVFKLLAADIVNMLLACYFVLLAAVSVANAIRPVLHDIHVLLAGAIGAAVAVAYLATKHWALNNLGLCFAVTGVEYLGLPSFKVGAILLSGLFFYDIFWVFGTEVMVSVATKFDAPIKLLFPRDVFAEELKFAMLGLGDIVIPGIFIALMYRFDLSQAGKTPGAATRRLYFHHTSFAAYVTGLVVCVAVMQAFRAAQPALLYLVPLCLGSVLLLAAGRRELGELFAYEEEKKEEEPQPDLPWQEQVAKLFHEVFLGRSYEPAPTKRD